MVFLEMSQQRRDMMNMSFSVKNREVHDPYRSMMRRVPEFRRWNETCSSKTDSSQRGHSNLMGRWEREVEEEEGASMEVGVEQLGRPSVVCMQNEKGQRVGVIRGGRRGVQVHCT